MEKQYTKNDLTEIYSWGLYRFGSLINDEYGNVEKNRLPAMSNKTLRDATSIMSALWEIVPYKFKDKKVEPAPEDKEAVEELANFVRFRFSIGHCCIGKTKKQIIDIYKKSTSKYVGTLYNYRNDKKDPTFYYLVEADGKKCLFATGYCVLSFWNKCKEEPIFIPFFA